MKKYIGYHANTTSAISTYEAVTKWAAKQLADRPNLEQVYICEVIEVCARMTPTIETKPFIVEAANGSYNHGKATQEMYT